MVLALVCVALLGILLFGLGFAMSLTRGRTGTASGSSGDPTDTLHLEKPHPLRFLGALGTYLFGLALCGSILRSL